MTTAEAARRDLATRAAHLLAIDPAGLGGAVLRGAAGSARDNWLNTLRASFPPGAPWRKVPAGIARDGLLGTLDLAATLGAGRPVIERGLLAKAAGGVLLLPNAERLEAGPAALIGAALDGSGGGDASARFAAIVLDEGVEGEEVPASLAERVAFVLGLEACSADPPGEAPPCAAKLAQARLAALTVAVEDAAIEALCATALACGVPSLRVASFALRAAKAAAALAGRAAVARADLEIAVALVVAPRATALPTPGEAGQTDEPSGSGTEPQAAEAPAAPGDGGAMPTATTETLVEAARAAIPPGLLAALSGAATPARRAAREGSSGTLRHAPRRGRPAGTRRSSPGNGAQLALVDTLRAAAPWQRLRARESGAGAYPGRILVRREDFRIARLKARSEAVTIFAVDASGSAALHRLAEAKGAVELILAECYARRDQVALIAFRNAGAAVVLPPTRSLARAKRALAGQVGGGGTPLAAALEAAAQVAAAARRRGQVPLVVLMTDGRSNVDRAGRPGRAGAEADARAAARAFRMDGAAGLLVDIAPRPADAARRLAAEMGARYLALPQADAQTLSRAVLATRPNE